MMASSSASTASSSSCDSDPASISSICCTQQNIRLRLQQNQPWNSFRFSCTHPLVFNGILSFIHDALYFFNRHHLTRGGGGTSGSLIPTDTAAVVHAGYFERRNSHLVHFLQTLVSGFQPSDDFSLNLSKLQVLDLENTQVSPTVKSHCNTLC